MIFRFIRNQVKRFFQVYNAEARADKFIEFNKNKFAPPRHDTKGERKRNDLTGDFYSNNPGEREKLYLKNLDLVKRVEQIKINSSPPHSPWLPPPQLTKFILHDPYGYLNTDHVPLGKLSYKQAMKLLVYHHLDPVKNSPEKLAKEYNLDENDAKNVVYYFRAFKLLVREDLFEYHEKVPFIYFDRFKRIRKGPDWPIAVIEEREDPTRIAFPKQIEQGFFSWLLSTRHKAKALPSPESSQSSPPSPSSSS